MNFKMTKLVMSLVTVIVYDSASTQKQLDLRLRKDAKGAKISAGN